ncbi:MAG: hypothetical protein JW973_04415 [Bacteroidales bacterium]|nr:hypothetical protein [Bacteroidales bacterium]
MPPLENDKYYHIYNRGNNREDLFRFADDYNYFLRLYEKYLNPVADTYAWVLMKNHFHLLIRIKAEEEIGVYLPLSTVDSVKFQTTGGNNLTESEGPVRVIRKDLSESEGPDRVINNNTINSLRPVSPAINSDRSEDSVRLKPDPTRHFAHLFNAYARYYNLKYKRTGTLFERPFKRIEVTSEDYLKRLVVYIHTNPVHHGFTENHYDYLWSSYQSILSSKSAKLQYQVVIDWFDDIENLKAMHQMKIDNELLTEILLE